MRGNKIMEFMEHKLPNWEFYSSPVTEGRLLIVWRKVFVRVTILEESTQYVHCLVKMASQRQAFYVTFVYGFNTIEGRRSLWQGLHRISLSNKAWIILEDFNAPFSGMDRSGGKPVSGLELADSLQWLADTHVESLKSIGSYFTWTNNQEGPARIYSKIDHVFMNEDWLDTFPHSTAVFRWEVVSDHCSCVVTILPMEKVDIKLFRFYNFWTDHPGFKEVVMSSWRVPIKATGLRAIYLKTMKLKHRLKKFNRDNIGDIGLNYHLAKEAYQEAQFQAQSHPRDYSLQEVVKVAAEAFTVQEHIAENGIATYISEQGRLIDNFHDVVSHFLHETTLSLVPKVTNPSRAIDYRPIACCSTLYKCIDKLLCSRIALVLHDLIQLNQGAFIRGHSIAHNIMIFQDLIKNYGRTSTSPRCAIKIDLSKAYDTVDWQFLEDLLRALCFPMKFIGWIMACLKNTSYSLLMNGRVQGSFKGKKGLRQGDPMSPLLFVLIMEYLTRSLQLAAQNSKFRFHPMCKSLKLLNADDLILFCKGTRSAVSIFKEVLVKFSAATGLSINANKSHIFFGGVIATERRIIAQEIQLPEGSFPLNKHLSFAGQMLLIHSVLFGLHNYWMSIFVLPQSIVKEVEKLCRGFLWGISGNRSKLHIASWQQVCLPKVYGGLGFRDGANRNRAILAKYIWTISKKPDILWVKWINAIYLKGFNFWNYTLKPDNSWYWRKLCHLRGKFSQTEFLDAGVPRRFKPSKLYNSTLNQQLMGYHQAVWCKLTLPKHRFLLW
ncbi:uncharacterized protein LOC133779975 [Humulus lupulus]|uniref:uncharacterized protein LOC133779975 n=1 Tax=Humulus lupulus TaxID=3486 RepID=UPI002B417607|nr:uncharacterized protein LOC133779975 [Humulus lupulus]